MQSFISATLTARTTLLYPARATTNTTDRHDLERALAQTPMEVRPKHILTNATGPPDPLFHVQPKPMGTVRLPRLLLIKPDCTCYEILNGLSSNRNSVGDEVITQKIKSPLYPSNNCLVRVLFQFQLI